MSKWSTIIFAIIVLTALFVGARYLLRDQPAPDEPPAAQVPAAGPADIDTANDPRFALMEEWAQEIESPAEVTVPVEKLQQFEFSAPPASETAPANGSTPNAPGSAMVLPTPSGGATSSQQQPDSTSAERGVETPASSYPGSLPGDGEGIVEGALPGEGEPINGAAPLPGENEPEIFGPLPGENDPEYLGPLPGEGEPESNGPLPGE